jgi:hypothetical protein
MMIRSKLDATILAATASLLAMPGYSIGEKIADPQVKLADARQVQL